MSDLLDEAHEFLLCMDKMEYADALFALRAELTEARLRASELERQVCDKHEAATVDEICNAYESGIGHRGRPTANVNPYRKGSDLATAYNIGAVGDREPSAPVQQPAVPEAVASDADWNHVPVGRVIGDPVWAGQLWRSQIQGTKKLRNGDLVYIRPAAILSATDSEVKK